MLFLLIKKIIKSVCTHVYDCFVNSASEVFKKRIIMIDKFFVSKLYRGTLDTLRINSLHNLIQEI